jgi:hypothetical protein
MKKITIQFDSQLDALVALAKRLAKFENRFNLASEDFFTRFTKGHIDDSEEYTEWANDYQHYLSIRRELVQRLHNAA